MRKTIIKFENSGQLDWDPKPGPTEHESALLTATTAGMPEKTSFYFQHPRSSVYWSLDYILFPKEDEMSSRHSERGCGPRLLKQAIQRHSNLLVPSALSARADGCRNALFYSSLQDTEFRYCFHYFDVFGRIITFSNTTTSIKFIIVKW